ncbi:hypothetical protein [Hymenobacter negativus]|uniref:Uncharacterized protein n=1 Tax=Hymenobacter negativus TaxID=2795026 RepID=A0ABS3QII4_9BACT|nr:hypothetical protein [Hymenobacter negativus]MBO2011055.1 hypothetical protein [Hymenobacter negativus]
MSVALLFQFPGQLVPRVDTNELITASHLRPVSTEKNFLSYWLPVIEAEGYAWLPIMNVGIDFDPENLPEVLDELRQLQAAFPRYYTPDDEKYDYVTTSIARLIAELEAINPDDLASGKLELFLG